MADRQQSAIAPDGDIQLPDKTVAAFRVSSLDPYNVVKTKFIGVLLFNDAFTSKFMTFIRLYYF